MTHIVRWLVAGLVLLSMSGCAATRSYMRLDVPAATEATSSSGKVVVIDHITDKRRFEADPDDPSTPSLKKGSKYALTAEGREQAIARKRNGYGHAWGDILLKPGQTVDTITRQLLTAAFVQRGYTVLDAARAPHDATRVSAEVRQFWAWLTPGFWSATIEARVTTLLKIDSPKGHRQVLVKGYGRNSIQTGREANWQLAYHRAFEDYLKQFDDAATNNGL